MTQIASQEDVDKILKAFYLVYNTLGYGFLESDLSKCPLL